MSLPRASKSAAITKLNNPTKMTPPVATGEESLTDAGSNEIQNNPSLTTLPLNTTSPETNPILLEPENNNQNTHEQTELEITTTRNSESLNSFNSHPTREPDLASTSSTALNHIHPTDSETPTPPPETHLPQSQNNVPLAHNGTSPVVLQLTCEDHPLPDIQENHSCHQEHHQGPPQPHYGQSSREPDFIYNMIQQQQQQINALLNLLAERPQTTSRNAQSSIQPTFSLPPLDQLLPSFGAREEDNPREFIAKFEKALKSFHLPVDMWKAAVRNQLTLSAKQWFDRNSSRFDDMSTFTDMFIQHFDSPMVQTKLKANLYGQRQITPENSEAFVNSKIKLYNRLFPHTAENQVVCDLIQLLHPSVQVHLLQTPVTLDELLRKLEIIDHANQPLDKGRNPPKASYHKQTISPLVPYQNNQTNRNYKTTPASPPKPPFIPTCRYCPGKHYHRDCPVVNQMRENHQPPSVQRRIPVHSPNNTQARTDFRPNPPNVNNSAPGPSRNNGPPPQNRQFPPPHNSNVHMNQQVQIDESSTRTDLTPPSNQLPISHNTNLQDTLYVSPSVNISIFNKLYPVMIDTGAATCFIERQELPEEIHVERTDEQYVSFANNERVSIFGTTTLTFQLGKSTYTQEFQVLHQMLVPLILGVDWMRTNEVVIDMSREIVTVGRPERENIPFVNRTTEQIRNAPQVDLTSVHQEIPEEHLEDFHTLLQEYSDIFNTEVLQQTTAMQHHIPLTSEIPVYTASYRLSPTKVEFIRKQIREMLLQNLIEPSDSPYNSPIVVIEYAEKEPRFCVDYRKINAITQDQNCPGVNIHELVRNIGDHTIFSTIDLKKGYWQVPLASESKACTAFSTPDGNHYQFKVMPFGLKGAPGTFIRLMGKVLEGLMGDIVEVYLDDLIIKSRTWESHIHNLRLVFERLRTFQLTAHLAKCHFGKREVTYLGHIITAEHNIAPSAHINAIQRAPVPKTKRQLQSFLGTCNWLREYVDHAAEVMADLYKITSRKPFKWTSEDDKKLQKVKDAFSTLTPLHRPMSDMPFVLQTDASNIGLGATLFQVITDKKHIIANISATLSDTERRYSSNEKECLAVLWAVTKFRPYLEGRPFVLRTDNRALLWLHKFKEERSKLTRWALTLQEYQFTVEHIAGSKNLLPDALSRNPGEEVAIDHIEENLFPPMPQEKDIPSMTQIQILTTHPSQPSLISQVKSAQLEDEYCIEKVFQYNYILNLHQDDLSPEEQRFLQNYQVINDALYYRLHDGDEWRIFVPPDTISRVIENHHDHPLYCHPGVTATYALLRPLYFWPHMQKEIAEYIHNCETCARTKVAGRTKVPPLKARISENKFHTWFVDLMGPYTPSHRGNKYLIVTSDLCSKWVEAKPVRQASTQAILAFLENEVFTRFGYPAVLVTDNGAQFRSNEWTQACQNWGTRHYTTAVYSPRQNQVERRNQSIKDKLRIQVLDLPHAKWDLHIPQLLYSMRNTINQATKVTPAEVLFNQRLRHPTDEILEEKMLQAKSEHTPLLTKHQQAIENQRKYITNYQRDAPTIPLHPVGAIVYIKNHELSNAAKGITSSLNPKWIGPYQITEAYPPSTYLCESLDHPQDVRKISHRDTQLRSTPDTYVNGRIIENDYSSRREEEGSEEFAMYRRLDKERCSRDTTEPYDDEETQNRKAYHSRRNRKPNPKYYGSFWESNPW